MAPPVILKGFDASWGWPDLQVAWNAGYRVAFGYLSRDPTKNWTVARLRQWRDLGGIVGFNWETTVDAWRGGYLQGQVDAKAANDQIDWYSAQLGEVIPPSVWNWASVDMAATADQVRPYFQGARTDKRRGLGGYGGIELQQLKAEGLIDGWWETNAGSWDGHTSSNFETDPGADSRQITWHTINAGGSTDEDWFYDTAGLWLPAHGPLAGGGAIRSTRHSQGDEMFIRRSDGPIMWAGDRGYFILTGGQGGMWDHIAQAYAAVGQQPVVVEDDALFDAVVATGVQASAAVNSVQQLEADVAAIKQQLALGTGSAGGPTAEQIAQAVQAHLVRALAGGGT